MKSIVGNLYIEKNGSLMDVLEQFYIFENTKLRHEVNNKCKSNQNLLFDPVIQNTTIEESYS